MRSGFVSPVMSLGNGVFGACRHMFEIDISFLTIFGNSYRRYIWLSPEICLFHRTGGFEWEDISKAWKG